MAGFDRSRIRLGNRTQQQTDTAEDKGGSQRKSFMDYRKCRLEFFKFADPGKYQDINILPWRIATKNHPEVVAGNMQVGDFDYVLDVWVHTRIGPNEEDCVCLRKTYGKACPICEEGDKLWADESTKESAKALFSRRRCVYLVDELNDKFQSTSNKPKIFEVAHGNFTKDLQSKATSCLRGNGVVNFADPSVEEGRIVSFTVVEDTMGGNRKYKKAGNFEFNKRTEEISDELLENCPSLDEMLVVKTPEQMKAMLFGEPDEDSADNSYAPRESATEEQPSTPVRFADNAPAQEETRRPTRFTDDEQGRPTRFTDDTPAPRAVQREATRETSRPAAESRRVVNEPVNEPVRRSVREATREDSTNGYQQARMASRRDTSVSEDTSTMPFDEPALESDRPRNRNDFGDIQCPYNYRFGEDCDRGSMCGKCPDHIYSKCLAIRNGEA